MTKTEDICIEQQKESLIIWIEEYKALSADIQNRVTLQQGLLNYLLLAFSISAVIIAALLKDANLNQYQNECKVLILILPTLSSFFVLRHSEHDLNIIDKAKYINNVLRPNIILLTGDQNILGFEKYLNKSRNDRLNNFGNIILAGIESSFHLFFVGLTFYISLYAFFLGSGELTVISYSETDFLIFLLQDVLLLIDSILFVLIIKVIFKVGSAYRDIV